MRTFSRSFLVVPVVLTLFQSVSAFAGVNPPQFVGNFIASGCNTDSQALVTNPPSLIFPRNGDRVEIYSNAAIALVANFYSAQPVIPGDGPATGGFNLILGKSFTDCGFGAKGEECLNHAATSTGSSLTETDTDSKSNGTPISGGTVAGYTLTLNADNSISLSGNFIDIVLAGQTVNLNYTCTKLSP